MSILLGLTAGHGRAAPAHGPTIRLACPIAPQAGQWACLRVFLPPTSGQLRRVSIRDGRGGPAIIRTISARRQAALFPLPFLQPNDLSAGSWPVRLTIATPAGQTWRATIAVFRLPAGHGLIPIATLPQTRHWLANLGNTFTPLVLAAMPISQRQLLHTPVLALAACRYLLLNAHALRSIPLQRALALLSANIVLIYHGTMPPRRFQSRMPSVLWKPLQHSKDFWTIPSQSGLPRKLPLVVWRLGQTPLPPLAAPHAWTVLVWVCIPVGLILILLTRLASPRPLLGLGLLVLVFALFAASASLWLTPAGPQFLAQCRWISQRVPGDLARISQLDLAGSPRGQTLHLTNNGPLPPLPLVASAQQWFALRARIYLHRRSGSLELLLPPSAVQPVLYTHVQLHPPLPRRPSPDQFTSWLTHMRVLQWHPRRCVFMVAGRIFPLTNPTHEMAFNFWIQTQPPALRVALRCWFALNFSASNNYLLEVSQKLPASLRVLNFLPNPAQH
ncbi:MAG: hypothetical protein HKL95_05125 [Phycisphaerae bacterium]|nr:hypothetical protein [Phycisphaerae bacterium]